MATFRLSQRCQPAGHPLNERPMSTALRPSACPGLLRIVPALDGGICRIKLAGGVISADQAVCRC
jgi:precorrin-3B synthase